MNCSMVMFFMSLTLFLCIGLPAIIGSVRFFISKYKHNKRMEEYHKYYNKVEKQTIIISYKFD